MIIDRLIDRIIELKNPTVVGLDPIFEPLDNILKFNIAIIDAIYDIVPAVKPQISFYEQHGAAGVDIFIKTIKYAKSKGLFVISDIKRGDIASTAEAYASSHLGEIYNADFATVNPYMGYDSVSPFIDICKKNDKGIFVLVKTSNKGSNQIQNLDINGKYLYEIVGNYVLDWGRDFVGKYGYSNICAVVGATYPEELKNLRSLLPSVFFLVPGYGAQGGSANSIKNAFSESGLGAIINSSRAIIYANKIEKYKNLKFQDAARQAALDMKEELNYEKYL